MKTKSGVVIFLFSFLLLAGCDTTSDRVEPSQPGPIDWEYQMAYQRGIEVVNWSIPAVSMIRWRDACFGLGGGFNTVYWLSEVPTAKQEALTPNNQTPYSNVILNTKNGPVVLEIPAASERTALFGSAVDIWQEPIADIGPAGADKGKGGKYLFLPPDYNGEEIEGFINVHSKSYQINVAVRCIPIGGATFQEAAEYAKNINAYSIEDINDPPQGQYIDMAGKHLPTLPEFDSSYFGYVKELIDTEPLQERDMVMGGMLASIGIKKDTPFAPNQKVKNALEKAVVDGYNYMEYMFETPGFSFKKQWEDRQWMNVREPSSDGFVFDEGEYLLLDDRGSLFHWATFFPKRLGKATAYLNAMKDANGNFLKGEKQYRLKVPAQVPARDFWSVIVYSKQTKAWIYNELGRVGLSSFDMENMKLNDDASVDIYFSKSAPEGLESNWIPTNGEDFFLLFRFYGPEEAYYDKSFVLPDVEPVE